MADELELMMRAIKESAAGPSKPVSAGRSTVTLRGLAISLALMGIYTAAHLSFQRLFGLSAEAATALTVGLVLLIVAVPLAILHFRLTSSNARLKRPREELAASVWTMEALLSQVPQITGAENNPEVGQAREQWLAEVRRLTTEANRLSTSVGGGSNRKHS